MQQNVIFHVKLLSPTLKNAEPDKICSVLVYDQNF